MTQQQAIDEIAWWHSIELAPGHITQGAKTTDYLEREWAALHLPDLRGKTMLDVGAWDGYHSFAAERAGAARVVALDYYTWSVDLRGYAAHQDECRRATVPFGAPHEIPALWHPDTLPGKRGFDLAHQALSSRVEAVVGDFTDMDLEALGRFDVVLFLGVLYHLTDPLGAARRLSQVTRELAIVESEALHVPGQEHLALWQFHGVDHLGGGPGNWWVPNRRALEHVLAAAGFASIETVDSIGLAPSEVKATHYRTFVHAGP
jgi:tRNA (mo5U34)-methyltransferase